MFENGGDERRAPMILQHPVTAGLLAVNILVYIFQYYVAPRMCPGFSFEDHFALSLEGLRAGNFWQLLTYQFMHGGLLHIIFNCWAIYIFGQVVESSLGRTRILVLYLAGGVVGGLVQTTAAKFWPQFFDGPMVGASAGACALLAAFSMLFPRQRMMVLLLFIIPVSMRASTLLRIVIGLTLFGLLWPFLRELPVFHLPLAAWDHGFEAFSAALEKHGYRIENIDLGAIAHGGHLGGLITGILGSLWFIRRYGPIATEDIPSEIS